MTIFELIMLGVALISAGTCLVVLSVGLRTQRHIDSIEDRMTVEFWDRLTEAEIVERRKTN